MKEKRTYRLWSVLCLVGASFFASLPAYAETLQDSVINAIIYHPAIEARKASQKAAEQDITEARSNYYPSINVTASAGRVHADDDTTRSLAGGADQSYLGTGSVTLQQILFDGFEVRNMVDAAEFRENSAVMEISVSSEDIALRALQAHLNVMRTRELFNYAAEYALKLQEYIYRIDLLVKEGAADESELLLAKELLVNARNVMLNFEDQAAKAETDYYEAVGTYPGEILLSETGWQSYLPETLEAAIELGLAEHPRILAARNTSRALDHEKDAERAQIVPKFNAEMSYSERDQKDNLGGESTNAQALIRMSWNFSTGGAYAARVRKAGFRHAESVAREEEILRLIEKNIRTAYVEIETAEKRHKMMMDREDANRRILETYTTQFEGGKRSLLQIVGAENRLFDATIARINVDYRLILTKLQYLSAMGHLRQALNALPEEEVIGEES